MVDSPVVPSKSLFSDAKLLKYAQSSKPKHAVKECII